MPLTEMFSRMAGLSFFAAVECWRQTSLQCAYVYVSHLELIDSGECRIGTGHAVHNHRPQIHRRQRLVSCINISCQSIQL